MKKEQTETLGLRIPISIKAQLQARANENEQSLSEYVIDLFKAHLGTDNKLIKTVNSDNQISLDELRREIEDDTKKLIAERIDQHILNTTAILDRIYERLEKLESLTNTSTPKPELEPNLEAINELIDTGELRKRLRAMEANTVREITNINHDNPPDWLKPYATPTSACPKTARNGKYWYWLGVQNND